MATFSSLKALLPHSEIVSTTSEKHSEQASHSRLVILKQKVTAPASSENESDSNWSDGDGTIDEFVSSEEQPHLKARTFSALSSSHTVDLSLPSLLRYSKQTESVPPSSSSSETSVSGSGTFGSLQQSPIDLSFDSPGEILKTEYETDALASDDQLTNIATRATTNEAGEIEYEQHATTNEAARLESTANGLETTADITTKEEEDWCLTLDLSGDEISPSDDDPCRTPCRKRRKLERSSTNNPAMGNYNNCTPRSGRKKLRNRYPPQPQGSHDSDVCIVATQYVHYIDLTTEDDDSLERRTKDHQLYDSVNSPKSSITKKSSASLNLKAGMEPDVIILSDSKRRSTSTGPDSDVESDQSVLAGGLGSPLCLPPTPGREGVESILQRKSIAFS